MTVAEPTWPRLEEVVDGIRGVIAGSTDIVCLAHKDADADSLGSALAFADALRMMGKRAHPTVPDPLPELLRYLPGFETIEAAPAHMDAVFTFDCATLGRFGEKSTYVERSPCVVNIDHHVSNEGFGHINLIEPQASATGQVVYGLLRALGAPISRSAATNLYAALFTDTGGFRHENTTEATLHLGADLVALGADPSWVALKAYGSRSVPRLVLEGLAVARMQVELGGRLVWSEITLGMLDEAGADMQESEGVIDQLQSVDTMKIAVLLKENSPVATKVSVRTRDEYDATDVCVPFGGGGHRRAAGAEIAQPIAVARDAVLQVARDLLQHPR